MVRRTWAPSFVWCCTFHRKMSPTEMWTRSRSPASMVLWVPLPLPWTPMMTYFRMRVTVGACSAGLPDGLPDSGNDLLGPPAQRSVPCAQPYAEQHFPVWHQPPLPVNELGAKSLVRIAASEITPDASAMMAATSRIWSSPDVKAALVTPPTACRTGPGTLANSRCTWPDFTAPAISAPRPDRPGTA